MITKEYLQALKQAELMALLGLSDRRIQQLHAEGLPRNGAGRGVTYDWASVRAWETNRIAGSFEGEESDKARKLRAEADMAEMERDLQNGTLLQAEDVRKTWCGELANMRARLLSIPSKAAVRIEDGMALPVREDLIRDEIYEALEELSGRNGEDHA